MQGLKQNPSRWEKKTKCEQFCHQPQQEWWGVSITPIGRIIKQWNYPRESWPVSNRSLTNSLFSWISVEEFTHRDWSESVKDACILMFTTSSFIIAKHLGTVGYPCTRGVLVNTLWTCDMVCILLPGGDLLSSLTEATPVWCSLDPHRGHASLRRCYLILLYSGWILFYWSLPSLTEELWNLWL